jgi:HK97 family phage prohead protease
MVDTQFKYGPSQRIGELKAIGDAWEVSGYPSVYGIVDHGNDVVMRGAFDYTLDSSNKVRFLYAHDTRQVLGVPIELRSDDRGLYGRFKISKTQLGQDVHTLLQDKALDSFSIGYVPTDVEYDDAGVRQLKAVDLLEVSLVALPMLDDATVTAVKDDAKATWSTSFMNNLPDSAFAIILPGGKKDSEGKTVPRSLRKLPHHDMGGKVDLPHLRAALTRVEQENTDLTDAQRSSARGHLKRHAKSEGIGNGNGNKDDAGLSVDLDVPFEDVIAQVKGFLILGCDEAEALAARRAEIGRKLASGHTEAIDDLLHEAEACAERLHRLLTTPPAIKTDGDLNLRLELARRMERRRELIGAHDG